jgi:hypothetical protein
MIVAKTRDELHLDMSTRANDMSRLIARKSRARRVINSRDGPPQPCDTGCTLPANAASQLILMILFGYRPSTRAADIDHLRHARQSRGHGSDALFSGRDIVRARSGAATKEQVTATLRSRARHQKKICA